MNRNTLRYVNDISLKSHDDVIKWKHSPRYWPFVRGIHRWPVNSPHRGQWRGALMFSLICAWISDWVNNGEAGDLRRHCAHYGVTVMIKKTCDLKKKDGTYLNTRIESGSIYHAHVALTLAVSLCTTMRVLFIVIFMVCYFFYSAMCLWRNPP